MSLSDFQCFSSQKLTSPGGMNWRGTWGIPGVYQYGDVVLGPDNEGYVCIDLDGTIATVPGTSPATWQLLSSGTATAVSLSSANGSGITVAEPTTNNFTVASNLVAGSGISLTPSGVNTSLTVGNSGVLGVSAGTGITVGGTAQNPSIANAGVLAVGAGTGISVGGTAQNPIITNSISSSVNVVQEFINPPISATTPAGGAFTVITSYGGFTAGKTYLVCLNVGLSSSTNDPNKSCSIALKFPAIGVQYTCFSIANSTTGLAGNATCCVKIPAGQTGFDVIVSGFGYTTETATGSINNSIIIQMN